MSPLYLALCFSLSAVLVPLLFFLTSLKKKQPTTILPPGPRPWPVVGNLLNLGILLQYGGRDKQGGKRRPQPLHSALASLCEPHGPLVYLRLGTRPVVVAFSSAAAYEVLRTNDRVVSARHVPATYTMPIYSDHSLVWSVDCDTRWKSLRSVCQAQLFSPRSLESGAPMREKKAEAMVRFVAGGGGAEVKVADVVFRTVFNIFGNAVFSTDLLSLDGGQRGEDDELKKLMDMALELGQSPNSEDYFPGLLGGLDLQGLRMEVNGVVLKFYAIWDRIIKERKDEAEVEEKTDMLQVLLQEGLEGIPLKSFLQDIFTAGTDTTTNLVEWTMAELLKNPDILAKVREEIEALIGDPKKKEGNVPKESDLPQLRYLHACIKESLRLHPPAPLLLPRRASDSCQAMGYTIPKGSMILVNAWAIGRDPKSWEDPLTFRPERFMAGNVRDYKGMDFELIPFGSGRRVCPGMPLAARMAPLVLASLVHNFDWSLPDGRELSEISMEEKPGLVLQRKEPLILIPKPRV